MGKIDDIIEDLNSGELSYLKMFGNNYQLFFEFIDLNGQLDEIEIDGNFAENYQNELLLYYYKHNKGKFYHYCKIYLSDIEIEGDKIYCVRNSAGDFSILYCNDRNQSQEGIESILNGDLDFDWFNDYNVDVYRYVIEELNDKNLKDLKSRFVAELSNVQIPSETELLEEIAIEQGHEDYVIIDSNNIDRIINDEKTTNFILNEETNSEIMNDLQKIYSYAERTSLVNETYEDVWNELTSSYFKGNPIYFTQPHPYKQNTHVEKVKLEIDDFDGIITDYLRNNSMYGNSGLLEYQGSYLDILNEITDDCLSVRFPEYANYTEKYINEYFYDYF